MALSTLVALLSFMNVMPLNVAIFWDRCASPLNPFIASTILRGDSQVPYKQHMHWPHSGNYEDHQNYQKSLDQLNLFVFLFGVRLSSYRHKNRPIKSSYLFCAETRMILSSPMLAESCCAKLSPANSSTPIIE